MSIWGNYRPGVAAMAKDISTDPMEPPDYGLPPNPNPAPQEMTPPVDPNKKWLNRQLKTRAFLEANPDRRASPMGRRPDGSIALANPSDRDFAGSGAMTGGKPFQPPTSAPAPIKQGKPTTNTLMPAGAFNGAIGPTRP